jgi:hypothetical protein
MRNTINYGGFAFPITEPTRFTQFGLTARDYFAAAVAPAFAPLLAPDYREAARRAYALADAMIAERESAKTEA